MPIKEYFVYFLIYKYSISNKQDSAHLFLFIVLIVFYTFA